MGPFRAVISGGYFAGLFRGVISLGYFVWLFRVVISCGYFVRLFRQVRDRISMLLEGQFHGRLEARFDGQIFVFSKIMRFVSENEKWR